jgi:putative redox protein
MTVVVRGVGAGPFSTEVTAGRHKLLADEPIEAGGEDTGSSPYELLLASLGSCTVMTLRLYAARQGWPLDAVTVVLSHDRIYAEDCADCETKDGRLDRISREITLDGDLTVEQRARLMRIAERCPIHRTLTSEIVIETRAGGAASAQ